MKTAILRLQKEFSFGFLMTGFIESVTVVLVLYYGE